MEREPYKNLIIALPFFTFAIILVAFTIKFPIRVPITDDWLYLPQGSRFVSANFLSYFDLVNGHQQVLTKICILCVSYLPGNYVQNLTVFNIFIVSVGLYLIALAHLGIYKRGKSKSKIFVALLILLNFKGMCNYMSATGLGLSIAVLLMGTYFFGKNAKPSKRSRNLVLLSLFLSPFATGLGIIIPMSHVLSVIILNVQHKKLKNYASDLITASCGLGIAYLVPIQFNNVHQGSGNSSVFDVANYLTLIINPVKSTILILGLVGNPLIPSSRFDPLPQVILGLIVSALFIEIIRRSSRSILLSKLCENKNSLTSGLMFFILIVTFRSNSTIVETLGSRYVLGSLIFLFGAYVYLLDLEVENPSKFIKKISALIAAIAILSTSGMKTGLEWLVTRSSQSQELYSCIIDRSVEIQLCSKIGDELRLSGSTDIEFSDDLQKFRNYIATT